MAVPAPEQLRRSSPWPADRRGRGGCTSAAAPPSRGRAFHEQLGWAIREAATRGVRLDAAPADLDHMVARRRVAYKHLFLDNGATGRTWPGPGSTAFRKGGDDPNPAVSHLFIHLSDRFARPELVRQAMALETELLHAGLTVVFSNRVSEPRTCGPNYFPQDMLLLYEYTENGQFLQKLAIRVLQTQTRLAAQGYRTGGKAPYGFTRVLVDAAGAEVQELRDGMTARLDGCRVALEPRRTRARSGPGCTSWTCSGRSGGGCTRSPTT